jgi:hypothetical protein
MLKELEGLSRCSGDDFDRSHQEGFLLHLLSTIDDAFLAEINCYYGCNLPANGITPGKLRDKIVEARGENASELKELYQLEQLQGSWLNHVNAMRHHSMHRAGVPRVYNLSVGGRGGPDSTWLRNPETGQVIEEDFPRVFRQWYGEMADIVARLRSSAMAQLAS